MGSSGSWTGRRKLIVLLGALFVSVVGFDLLDRKLTPIDDSVPEPLGSTTQVESIRPEIRRVADGIIEIELGGRGGPGIEVGVQGVDVDRLVNCLEQGFDRTMKARRQDPQVDFLSRRMRRRPMQDEVHLIHQRCIGRLSDRPAFTD